MFAGGINLHSIQDVGVRRDGSVWANMADLAMTLGANLANGTRTTDDYVEWEVYHPDTGTWNTVGYHQDELLANNNGGCPLVNVADMVNKLGFGNKMSNITSSDGSRTIYINNIQYDPVNPLTMSAAFIMGVADAGIECVSGIGQLIGTICTDPGKIADGLKFLVQACWPGSEAQQMFIDIVKQAAADWANDFSGGDGNQKARMLGKAAGEIFLALFAVTDAIKAVQTFKTLAVDIGKALKEFIVGTSFNETLNLVLAQGVKTASSLESAIAAIDSMVLTGMSSTKLEALLSCVEQSSLSLVDKITAKIRILSKVAPEATAAAIASGSSKTWIEFYEATASRFSSIEEASRSYIRLKEGESPWPEGFVPQQAVLNPGDTFQMVLDNAQPVTSPGGFGTFDNIPNVSYARNNLAIQSKWKVDCGKVVTYRVKPGVEIPVLEGPVGPQIDLKADKFLSGGGSQIQMLFDSGVNIMDYLEVVSVRSIY